MAMKPWAVGVVLASVACLAAGCMSPGVVKVSADTYKLSRVDAGGAFPDAAAMRASVIDEANAFARSRGMIAVPVSMTEDTMRVGHLSTVDYEFRLAAPGEPAPTTAGPAAKPAAPAANPVEAAREPGIVADQNKPAAVDAPSAGKADAKPDLYTELIKLDELRKRGILTEEEFQALKTKLIAGK
jgi:hypothetical protein